MEAERYDFARCFWACIRNFIFTLLTPLQEKLVWTRVDAEVEKQSDHRIKDPIYNKKTAEARALVWGKHNISLYKHMGRENKLSKANLERN